MLYSTGDFTRATKGWTVVSWIQVAFIPAALYTLQNTLALLAYQNLDGVTFNVLNQTKTLSAAMCCYLLMGKRQSRMQIVSLLLLLLAALVLERIISIDFLYTIMMKSMMRMMKAMMMMKSMTTDSTSTWMGTENRMGGNHDESTAMMDTKHFTHGVVPVLGASFLSGLAGAISQKNLQSSNSHHLTIHSTTSTSSSAGKGGRNPYLFSAELCVASLIVLSLSLLWSDDGQTIKRHGFFQEWTPFTLIPILTNAMGGIVVGLVTKYAGSVRKGFALIFGMLLTGIIQSTLDSSVVGDGASSSSSSSSGLSMEQIVGGLLASLSLWLHATHPYVEPNLGTKGEMKKNQ
jgi:UDP-sugar transporter A1/2/3